MNIIQKMGVATSLVLASSYSMAAVYDLTGTGVLGWSGDRYSYYKEVVIDAVTDPVADGEGGIYGSFSDSFTFTVPEAPENQVWSFTAEAVSWNYVGASEFNNLSFQGYTGSDIKGDYGGEAIAAVGIGSGWWRNYSTEEPPVIGIMPGSYTLSVSGMARLFTEEPREWWQKDGGYEFSIKLFSVSPASVSPVPEPSSIALMLGGLGLVGFMAARRRKQS